MYSSHRQPCEFGTVDVLHDLSKAQVPTRPRASFEEFEATRRCKSSGGDTEAWVSARNVNASRASGGLSVPATDLSCASDSAKRACPLFCETVLSIALLEAKPAALASTDLAKLMQPKAHLAAPCACSGLQK